MKILIIDDDDLVSLSLKTIVEASGHVEVIALGKSGEEAIKLYELHRPDILLMDIRMGEMTGIEAAKNILKNYPSAKILFLTTFSDNEYIISALHIGAKGYILKQEYQSIVSALEAVYRGQSVFGGEIVSKIPDLMKEKQRFKYEENNITQKEIEVIELVAAGYNNKEISEKLYLSEGTVRNYLSSILEKLHLRDRTQLAIFYYKQK